MSRRDPSSAGPNIRLLRVGETLRHAIAQVIHEADVLRGKEELGILSVTVTQVRVSPDLRHATVYVSALGGQGEAAVTKQLQQAEPVIRGGLKHLVAMKYLPHLLFRLDTSFSQAGKVEALLSRPDVVEDVKRPQAPETQEADD